MSNNQHNPSALDENIKRWNHPEITIPKDITLWEFRQTGKKQQLNLYHKEKDIYLYSPINIDVEVRQWAGHFNPNQVEWMIIYGVGIGYYYEGVKTWLQGESNRKIIFLEDNLEIIRAFFETTLASTFLEDSQAELIYIKDLNDPPFDSFLKRILYRPLFVSSLASYRSNINPAKYQRMEFFIQFFRDLYETSTMEYLLKGTAFFQNYYHNFIHLDECLNGVAFKGLFKDVPAIICGAGPSLEKNAAQLKPLMNRALIFAGGTAINALNAFDVYPHFGCGIDPFLYQFTRFIANKAYETPIFFRSRMNTDALSITHGPKLYLAGSQGYPIADWIDEQFGYSPIDLENGSNVVNMSLSIAHLLGCNPIICVGLDLSYTNGMSYPAGITSHGVHDPKEQFITKGPGEELQLAKDIYGNTVYTLMKWILESTWYTAFKSNHPDITLLNCTEGGIGFDKVPNLSLKEAEEKYLNKSFDLEGMIAYGLAKASEKPAPQLEQMHDILNQLSTSLKKCVEILEKYREEEPIQWRKKAPEENEKLEKLYEALHKEMAYENLLKPFDKAFKHFIASHGVEKAPAIVEILSGRLPFLIEIANENLKQIKKALKNKVRELEALKTGKVETFELPFIPSFPKEEALNVEIKEIKDENGKLLAKRSYLNDVPQGLFQYFHPNGQVLSDTYYSHGKKEGIAKTYSKQGNVLSIKQFHQDLEEKEHYYFYPNKNIKTILNFKDGLLDGDVILYHPNGHFMRKLFYSKGKKEGKDELYSFSGTLVFEAEYQNDFPINSAKIWYQDGTLAKEIIYGSPGVIQTIKRWDLDGSPLAEQPKESDYFDSLTKESLHVGETLKTANTSLQHILNAFTDDLSASQKGEFHKEFDLLAEEFSHLEDIGKQLQKISGLQEASPKEIIWKTPAHEKILKELVSTATFPMQESLIKLESQLNAIISKLKLDQ